MRGDAGPRDLDVVGFVSRHLRCVIVRFAVVLVHDVFRMMRGSCGWIVGGLLTFFPIQELKRLKPPLSR
jgi:hypothetical protein